MEEFNPWVDKCVVRFIGENVENRTTFAVLRIDYLIDLKTIYKMSHVFREYLNNDGLNCNFNISFEDLDF